MKKQLLSWQENCLNAWESNGFNGIAHVITGAGKTILAIAAITRLFNATNTNLKIKIVVPKTFIMYQWHTVLREELEISREDIGFFSGSHKSSSNKPFMLYVINSARDVLARHVVEDVEKGDKVFLIADECHHYGSLANSEIFGYKHLLPQEFSPYTLGLSATPWCTNYNEVLVPALGDEIYRFGFLAALHADVINQFVLFNIRVSFSPEERDTYDELSNLLSIALYKLSEIDPNIKFGRSSSFSFFATLKELISSGETEVAELAKTILILTLQRRSVVYQAKYRIEAVIELLSRIPKSAKIIIFGERIETAIEINQRLSKIYHNEVGVYHSKVPKQLGIHTLRQFEDGSIRILVTCKTLDEGLNIANTDVGIVVSSTGSRRQRVQRLGRVLRKKPDGKKSHFYYLYIGDTTEEEELLKEIIRPEYDGILNNIDLYFDEETGIFENPKYNEWESAIVQRMVENGSEPEEVIEFMRNADSGILTEDWLMSESQCLKKINSATTIAEKNYYIAMLLIIRERMAK